MTVAKSMLAKLMIRAGAALALPMALAGTAAHADYDETYNFNNAYTLSNFINYNEYTLGSPGISYQIGSFAPGENSFTEGISSEAGEVNLTTIMGTSALDTGSPNHLVVAVSPDFYAQRIGDPAANPDFNQVFGTAMDEQDVVGALNTINNPGSTDTNQAFNTLYSFAGVMKADGATFGPNGSFDLVSFSDGKLFGIGTISFTPAGGAAPEPASWALMIGGFGVAGAALRRRRRDGGLRRALA